MRKVFSFILLLCHINASMFLPQVAEDDVVNSKGQYKDDINSISEYICVVLGYDHTADDEDDDSGQNFHLVNACDYFFQQEIVLIETKYSNPVNYTYAGYRQRKFSNPFYDIIAPPPKA